MMKRSTGYPKKGFVRSFMVFMAILGLLLSSCIIKYNIKNLLGLQHSSEQSHNVAQPNGVLLNSANTANCLYNLPSEITTEIQQADFNSAGKILSAFVCSSFYFLLLGILSGGQKITNAAFRNNLRFACSIPIFLQNRKLII